MGYWNEDYGLYGIEDSDMAYRINAAGLENRYISYSELFIRHTHSLYMKNERLDDEIRKVHGVSDEYTAMFYFNNSLFSSGLRPLYVERKFRAYQRSDGLYDFSPDPAYLRKEQFYLAERDKFIREYKAAVASASADEPK